MRDRLVYMTWVYLAVCLGVALASVTVWHVGPFWRAFAITVCGYNACRVCYAMGAAR